MKKNNKKQFTKLVMSLFLVTLICNCNVAHATESNIIVENEIPDGGNLLLRPKVGKVIYEYNIYALTQNNTLYYSLVDMIDILELAINFNEQTGKGEGWFLREDWAISLDLKNKQVISRGEIFPVSDNDVIYEDDIAFISQEALSKWLNMGFVADTAQQYLEIVSPYPLPGVARYYRQNKKGAAARDENIAKLPRKKIQYDWFDINTADVRLGTRVRKKPDQDTTKFANATVALEGQLLKHKVYTLMNADNNNKVTNVIARLSKKDEDPILLGPLKARKYTLGDAEVTNLPLMGNSGQELGFNVTNSKLDST